MRQMVLALALSPALLGAADLSVQWRAFYTFDDLGSVAKDISEPAAKGEAKHPAENRGALSVAGCRGKGIRLDGKSWLTIKGFKGGRGFTVAAWVRTKHSGVAQYIVSKGNNYAGSFYLRLQKDKRPRTAMLPVHNLNSIMVEGTEPLNDGKWHHVAGMMDGRELTLYVDGRLVGCLPFFMKRPAALPVYDRLTWIGSFDVPEDDGEPDTAFFVGEMDEVHLLDGAVTPGTIARWAHRE